MRSVNRKGIQRATSNGQRPTWNEGTRAGMLAENPQAGKLARQGGRCAGEDDSLRPVPIKVWRARTGCYACRCRSPWLRIGFVSYRALDVVHLWSWRNIARRSSSSAGILPRRGSVASGLLREARDRLSVWRPDAGRDHDPHAASTACGCGSTRAARPRRMLIPTIAPTTWITPCRSQCG